MALDLNKIIEKDSKEIRQLKRELKKKGWHIVKMPPELTNLVTKCVDPMNAFFSKDLKAKNKHNYDYVFGYTNVDHKESFRWITGDRFNTTKLPKESKKCLVKLTNYMDKFMEDLTKAISIPIFGVSTEELGRTYDLPLLNESRHWAMLDIAHYLNDPSITGPASGDNCEPHVDPGLLSLSILSTAPGLELFDPKKNKWILHDNTSDKNLGIIWCGTAAKEISKGNIKAGLHKVVRYSPDANGETPKRMAMWYEICTSSQEPKPESFLTPDTLFVDKISRYMLKSEYYDGIPLTKTDFDDIDNEPLKVEETIPKPSKANKTNIVSKNSNRINVANKMIQKEKATGIPPSKSSRSMMLLAEKHNGVPLTKVSRPQKYD